MNKILRYYSQIIKNSFMQEMEYRVDFVVVVFQAIIFVIFNLVFYSVIYENMGSIGDWTLPQMITLFGVYTLIDGIFMAFINPSISGLDEQVREGLFDSVLVKPMDSQFIASTRKINIKELPSALMGIGIMVYGLFQAGVSISLLTFLLSLAMFICSIIIFYSLTLIVVSIVFYIDKASELHEIIFSFKQFSKFPDVYSGAIRYLFMFGLPIVFSSFVPAGILFGKIGLGFVIYYIIITVVFTGMARVNWKQALKKYKSAGG